jgi:nicotinate phosphoribosyltransferase
MINRRFFIASEDEIKKGLVTDVYFQRIVEVLRKKGVDRQVVGEVRANNFPEEWPWAIFAGLEEVLNLFQGLNVNVEAMAEGTLFYPGEVVVSIEGRYLDFAVFETALLGLLCQATGIATKAARCKKAAQGRGVFSFGARRMHPAIAPMIERNAFIGGCDGVAAVESAQLIGEKPIGTMSHSFIICFEDEAEAFKAFDEVLPSEISRIALIDTFNDEKFGAIKAAQALEKKLFAVRLDTPKSRRGDFLKILEEVRWELDLRGFNEVKIFLSGGIDEHKISQFNKFADAYGVGTAISNAPVVDFSFDLVEVDGKPLAKRGKRSGAKQVWRCQVCQKGLVTSKKTAGLKCGCGGEVKPLLKQFLKDGGVTEELPSPQEIRAYTLSQIERAALEF